jgi:hypothetical protein
VTRARSSLGIVLVGALWLCAACGGATPTSEVASASPVGDVPTGAAATPTEPPPSFPTCLDDPTELHQAPELEAQLPEAVAGRELARWSIAGRCALDLIFGEVPGGVDGLLAGSDTPIDLAHINYAVAGRSDTAKDPPYFANAASRPIDENEIDLNLALLLGGGGFDDLSVGFELKGFDKRTIGGKEVFVGTAAMLTQNQHQRGRPYLYQTDDTMFLIITDDEAWAREALAALP